MSMSTSIALTSSESGENESDLYRSVSRGAVFSLVLGLLGLFSLTSPAFLILPIAGLFFAIGALINLKKYPTELSGRPIAIAGLSLSGLMVLVAPVQHAYIYATEVPDGYERISFSTLKSPLGAPDIPPKEALELDGKQIFVKGYVHPTSVSAGLAKNFVLVPDWATCCFGGQPPLTHMIEVTLTGDLVAKASNRKIRLAGTLRVDPQLKPITGLQGVYYQLRADHLK